MTEKPNELDNTVTTNQRLKAYRKCLGLLIEELEFIFVPDILPEQCGSHRVAYNKIRQFCPDRDILLKNVADAVLKSVKGEQNG